MPKIVLFHLSEQTDDESQPVVNKIVFEYDI